MVVVVVVKLMVAVVCVCVWGEWVGVELEKQDKVCMYIENEVGLDGNFWIEESANSVFSLEKKPQTFKIKTRKLLKTCHFHQYIS